MAMNNINNSSLVRPGNLDRYQGTAKSEKDGKAENLEQNLGTTQPPKPTDKAEISDAAHRMIDLRQAVDTGRDTIEALPDIREEKVEQAKKRLAQGYYNSLEVQDRIADKLGSVFNKMDEI